MAELMEWLAERGVATVFKVDGDRMTEHGRAWMVIVSEGPLGEDSFFRADLGTADARLDSLLAHLAGKGLKPDRAADPWDDRLMQLGAERYVLGITLASRGTAPPWLLLPLCVVLVLLGLALVVNFRGIPERLHEQQWGRQPGYFASYHFQRVIGAGLALGGSSGIVATGWQLATG
ncbi:hypothetical protein [Streptomyces wuyuanensis]|uniref:hypothetical protein n=1 Tax=Streptomyces wuyuanensis TaxID=1196353 RepID=UPI00344AC711